MMSPENKNINKKKKIKSSINLFGDGGHDELKIHINTQTHTQTNEQENTSSKRQQLGVWLSGILAGKLSIDGGRLSFQYEEGYLVLAREKSLTPLTQSLPLQQHEFEDQQCRPYFAGLLPEGHLRQLIAKQHQISRQNDFALLQLIGGECAGAISLMPIDETFSDHQTQDVKWLNDSELINVLDQLPQRPMLAGVDGLRLSLAGAQDKLPVIVDGQRIGIPRPGQVSTHIMKPAISSITDSVINEAFCMSLARDIGIKTAKTNIFKIRDRLVLLVERYDRLSKPKRTDESGQVAATNALLANKRLHQEDFCQAMGITPELKYQNEGGPDFNQCFELVRRVTQPSAPQLLHLLDASIFNALIGNHDAHGKNFSLLYKISVPEVAPLYDLLSTAIYPQLTVKMAMKIGSKYKFTEIYERDWSKLADDTGMSKAQTRQRILQIAKQLPIAANNLAKLPEFNHQDIVKKITLLIENRAELSIKRLK